MANARITIDLIEVIFSFRTKYSLIHKNGNGFAIGMGIFGAKKL